MNPNAKPFTFSAQASEWTPGKYNIYILTNIINLTTKILIKVFLQVYQHQLPQLQQHNSMNQHPCP